MKNGFPSVGRTALTVLIHPPLLFRGFRCMLVVWRRFFFFQYRSALFPRIPVSRADHELDGLVPFNPAFIRIYLDFVAFWIRITGFLCVRHGKRGRVLAAEFIDSITALYPFAFQVYRKNLSTTPRPRYTRGRFRLIHLTDPHLMCVPSLHVMIVIHAWTAFRRCLGRLGETPRPLADKVFAGALAITEAVLYVKQHSVNCVAAALYAMRRFDPALFSAADAGAFISGLFAAGSVPPEYAPCYDGDLVRREDAPLLREHIAGLYRSFVEAGEQTEHWAAPLLDFLGNCAKTKK